MVSIESPKRFSKSCVNCGKDIPLSRDTCPFCGAEQGQKPTTPQSLPPPPQSTPQPSKPEAPLNPPSQPSMSGEEIKGSFRATKILFWKSNIYYAFLFTPEKLVAAKIGTDKERAIGFVLGGVLGYYLAGRGDQNKKVEAMQKVSIKSILEADKDNFEIPYSEIKRFEIGKPTLGARLISDSPSIAGVVKIVGKDEQEFRIPSGQNFEECVNIVRSVLPDKLVVK